VLEPCFPRGAVAIEARELAETRKQGYSGIVLARACCRLDPTPADPVQLRPRLRSDLP
jgi:hypothetical protein